MLVCFSRQINHPHTTNCLVLVRSKRVAVEVCFMRRKPHLHWGERINPPVDANFARDVPPRHVPSREREQYDV